MKEVKKMKKLMIFLMAILLVACKGSSLEDISGYYSGSIEINGSQLPISLNFTHDDLIQGSLDIEVQGITNLELLDVSSSDKDLKFMVDFITSKGYFKGSFDGDVYEGTFTQNNISAPFKVSKTEKMVNESAELFNLEIEDVTITGEYIIPHEKGPIALIIAGSGMTDYNGNSGAGLLTNAYLYLAEALEMNGIASLRYNKRIINNPVSEADLSFDDFVNDAKAIVDLLQADPRFTDIYLIGHSQGALVAEIVAIEKDIDKVVLLAGAGRTIDHVLYDQIKGQLDESTLASAEAIFQNLKDGEVTDEVPEGLAALFRPSVQPFLISWIKYDPAELIKKISSHVQVIVGLEDLQVPVSEGNYLMEAMPEVRFDIIEGMNHVLKETSEDLDENLASYKNIDLPIHEELVTVIVEFFSE